jgi:ADP-ribosylation factor related protein 1
VKLRPPDSSRALPSYPAVAGHRELYGAPLLVLANKQDVPGSLAAVELQDTLGLRSLDGRPVSVQPCSAVSGDGLKAGVEWVVERVKKSQRQDLLKRRMIMGP